MGRLGPRYGVAKSMIPPELQPILAQLPQDQRIAYGNVLNFGTAVEREWLTKYLLRKITPAVPKMEPAHRPEPGATEPDDAQPPQHKIGQPRPSGETVDRVLGATRDYLSKRERKPLPAYPARADDEFFAQKAEDDDPKSAAGTKE